MRLVNIPSPEPQPIYECIYRPSGFIRSPIWLRPSSFVYSFSTFRGAQGRRSKGDEMVIGSEPIGKGSFLLLGIPAGSSHQIIFGRFPGLISLKYYVRPSV